jgi:arginine utilization protein RocB
MTKGVEKHYGQKLEGLNSGCLTSAIPRYLGMTEGVGKNEEFIC